MVWLGAIKEHSDEHTKTSKSSFIHPSRPGASLSLFSSDQVWVPQAKILKVLTPLQVSTDTGMVHNITATLSSALTYLLHVHNQ
jgi:hypothetical protein